MRTDGQMYGHDEVDSLFLHFANVPNDNDMLVV
jgi:hypothetical protein